MDRFAGTRHLFLWLYGGRAGKPDARITTLVLIGWGVPWRDFQFNKLVGLYLALAVHVTLVALLALPGNTRSAQYHEI